MPRISQVYCREILDSRANPTLETTVILDTGHRGLASVPSGSSIGKYEAFELRDNDPDRFNGLGVLKAVNKVNQFIGPKIIGFDPAYQSKLDQTLIDLDGTENKSNLGANSILSVSIAALKASAAAYNLPIYRYLSQKYQISITKLPNPTFNIINGGAHGAGNLDFQEFHLIPSTRYPYHQALRLTIEIYQNLKSVLKRRQAIHSVGDEGGFAPNLFTNLDALEIILEAIKISQYKFSQDLFLGLDVAANYFYRSGQYEIKDRAQPFSRDELINYYLELNREYHLFSLEDPLQSDDFDGWAKLTEELGSSCLIVADDLVATNPQRLTKALEAKACNAVLVKPNQIGTVTETVNLIKLCRQHHLKVIVSHRSGETNDTFIADLAVGLAADYTKFGAPVRGERVVKYNRLLQIETELNL